ncbi:ethanolamine phosphotransferase (EPT) [Trypanosoma equiperdum]|uniref:Ethanolamine phosphotransferase n=4 Tax=Trypanozoon TaxID=39700 RepID=Q388R8_TRYB2|nr:hypothetical protein, conserved [Trypanosoma brucei gambiense DAL972]XP_827814.1 hypothetical protein, conserved [Trypanosoma brucei brucei TREU927]RHW69033.1 ethanolamine phosphotransferase (EPT) [Trypanosoma brucei equiperdum]SCU72654.1 ethanolamine phosphotransferase (EPT) [Trypanosoma equiperdum]EAN78702.1 hypothetical protein, conserved [Trypanosoma brucei brucei TREU927]CBH16506.1 hypothetical protein, conserved [Trypanosoma brucei gambiense DAL972]|eukprot:XP_011778770.1 hypothetical protein, conserved [Trypanosoma brucei gambiense DAL972]
MGVVDLLTSTRCEDLSSPVVPQLSYLFEYVLSPVYKYAASLYPTTWTPNKVTLTGIFATVVSSLLLLTAMPLNTFFEPPFATFVPGSYFLIKSPKWMDAPGPSPLYPSMLQPYFNSVFTPTSMLLLCGFLNLIYCVADNTDGCLARRLKKTSNIGEYLDHGLDCVTSLMSTCVSMSVLGFSFSNVAVTTALVALPTILSHTLHYEKNIFIWGNRFVSVDEAMLFFFLTSWISLMFPNVGKATFSPALLNAVLPESWARQLIPLRCIDAGLVVCWISQCFVLVNIGAKSKSMFLRLPTIMLVLNLALLLAIIPCHAVHIEKGGYGTYTLGPFSYVALWIITMACTCSSIVHIPIYAHCAKLPQTDPLPLAGVILVCLIFVSCPPTAAVLAVVCHVGQIWWNVRNLEGSVRKVE